MFSNRSRILKTESQGSIWNVFFPALSPSVLTQVQVEGVSSLGVRGHEALSQMHTSLQGKEVMDMAMPASWVPVLVLIIN